VRSGRARLSLFGVRAAWPLGDGPRLVVAVAVVMLGAAAVGWFLTSVLLRPHD
jgi:hypothetical protein